MTTEKELGDGDELLVEMYSIEDQSAKIIKVVGVGGGGSNAVKNMYGEHPDGVKFAVCNTDSQALANCNVPVRIMLGKEGLGVGGVPEKGREAAEMSRETTAKLFEDGTHMVFITAGMGGGTGTGAAPVIARQAREYGVLTIGIVTLPFAFERRRSIDKALQGLLELRKNVDAMLVINNERLLDVYADGETTAVQAFKYADDILSHATLSIAEIITAEGKINCDFCDVQSTMKDGGSAIISVGRGSGEGRVFRALQDALNSPLLTGIEVEKAQRLLCVIYTGDVSPVKISEFNDLKDFMEALSPDLEFILGLYPDSNLGDEVKVSIIASGFNQDLPDDLDALREKYYGKSRKKSRPSVAEPEPEAIHEPEVAPQKPEKDVKIKSWGERLADYLGSVFEEN